MTEPTDTPDTPGAAELPADYIASPPFPEGLPVVIDYSDPHVRQEPTIEQQHDAESRRLS